MWVDLVMPVVVSSRSWSMLLCSSSMRVHHRHPYLPCRATNESSCTTSSLIVSSFRSHTAKAQTATRSSAGVDVSRETFMSVEVEPEAAEALFGDHIEQARSFTAALAAQGEE